MLGYPETTRLQALVERDLGVDGRAAGRRRARTRWPSCAVLPGVIAERRRRPADLISALRARKKPTSKLSDDEIVGFAILLLVAGNETTTNLLGNLLHRLAAGRGRLARCAAIPRAMRAIEEALRARLAGAVRHPRCARGHRVAGKSIAQGRQADRVSRRRQPRSRRWQQPELFEPRAERERHMAFGRGVHICIGAPLARLEAQVALAALLARFERIAPGAARSAGCPAACCSVTAACR